MASAAPGRANVFTTPRIICGNLRLRGAAMSHGTTRILILTVLVLAILAPERVASAQCNSVGIMARDVGMMPGNPFQAVRTTTRTPPLNPRFPASQLMKPEIVLRDSEGRVRFDRPFGEVHMDTGPDAGTDLEEHAVIICDPTQQVIIQLDNANRAATIRHRPVSLGPLSTAASVPYCRVPSNSKSPSNTVTEDLGHRAIEGFDALGWRTTTTSPVQNSSPPATMQRVMETWCSEELRAVLLEVSSGSPDGPKVETALTKIERTEPDAVLFQIPPDYTVNDRPLAPKYQGSGVAQPLPPSPPMN